MSSSTALRDVIESRLNLHWSQWAAEHPHLAAAIDRQRLVDSTVRSLRSDPAFIEAMRGADLDEAKLAAAARILDLAERLLRRLLP